LLPLLLLRGFPRDKGKTLLPEDKRFHVRVLVPCYKVSHGGC
jgi:hypothetical protein